MNTGSLIDNIVDWEYVGHTEMPPRSRLYCLEPIGAGTLMVESLTSYICRLAAAHSVTPWILVTREMSPLATVSTLRYNQASGVSCDVFSKQGSSSILSNGTVAMDGVNVLEQLTKRPGLARLTTLFSDGILSSRDLISPHQKFCPQCFQEWMDARKPVYLPLLWNFQHVKVCPVHQRNLISLCPHCERSHPPMARWLVPGFCPRCLKWMGNASTTLEKASEEDLTTCRHVGQLLVDAPIIKSEGEGGWSRSIEWIIKNWFNHAEGFAGDIGVSPSSVRDWLAKALPSLTSVLSLALQFRVNPTDLLLGNIGRFETLEPRSRFDLQPVSESFKRHHRKHDINKLEGLLNQAAASKEMPPMSLASVSRKAGVHLSFLARKFPVQAEQIKLRYRSYRSSQGVEHAASIHQIVRETVDKMLAAGLPLGVSKFRKSLPKGINVRDHHVITAWHNELKRRNLAPNKSS